MEELQLHDLQNIDAVHGVSTHLTFLVSATRLRSR